MKDIFVFYYSCYGVMCDFVFVIVNGIDSVLGMQVCICIVLFVLVVCEVIVFDILVDGLLYVELCDFEECVGFVFGLLICFGNMVVVFKYFFDGIML